MDADKRLKSIPAAILVWVALMLCVYYAPREGRYVLDLPDTAPVSIHGHVSGDVYTPSLSYRTDDAQDMERFLAPLRELRMRYTGDSNVYQVGEVSADVTVRFDDGVRCRFFLSDNGTVCCNDENYLCKDTAALQALLSQIQSWELYHESTP